MSRLSIGLTEKAYEIYKSIKPHERSKWVAEAIEEKHNKESNPFTEEQMKVIYTLKEEIEKLREKVYMLEDWKEYLTSI